MALSSCRCSKTPTLGLYKNATETRSSGCAKLVMEHGTHFKRPTRSNAMLSGEDTHTKKKKKDQTTNGEDWRTGRFATLLALATYSAALVRPFSPQLPSTWQKRNIRFASPTCSILPFLFPCRQSSRSFGCSIVSLTGLPASAKKFSFFLLFLSTRSSVKEKKGKKKNRLS